MSRSRPSATFAVLALSVASFATLQSLVVPVLPVIQQDLHTTTAGVTWTMTAWLIAAAVATPLLGRVGDLVGKRRVFVLALLAVALGSVIAAVAPSIGVLIAGRVVQGLGGAMFPLAFGIIRDEFPAHRLPSAIGAIASIIAVGSGLGTVLAGPLASALSWRGLFLVPVALTVTAAVLALVIVPESPTRATGGVNPWSAVLLSGWLIALLLPLSTGAQWGWSSPQVIGLFALAALLLAAWVVVELRSRHPLVDMRLMREPGVWSMNAAAVFIGAAMFAVFAFFPRFVQTPVSTGYGLGASVAESGLLMLPMLVTMAVTGFVSGPLERWLGFRTQIVIAAVVMAGSSLSLAFLHGSLAAVATASGVFGIGLGLIYAAITSVVVQSVPATQTGIASGMNANLRTVGSAIGAAVMTALVTGTLGAGGLPAESGYTEGFATAGVLAFGAAVVTVVAALVLRARAGRVAQDGVAAELAAVAGLARLEAAELAGLARPEAEASPAAGELAGLARPDGEASASAPAALRSAVAAPLPTAAAEAAEMARLIEKVEADRPTEPAVSAA
ncbi:MFS transporter [Leifsonia shinshuensis]|uniref:EmrB/QacA subfamily drug resistance transporter n=1 Tax=Leifsonia shinshuensis TaxID=150026 RepID=A0A853CZP8_9MICO|nr:MFS transporter [Leifsonia shinshuensis]NYJ25363.1 EmrB/QacA subfamily drug resistance transporter [Leifsonia shinshuensis]